MQMAAAALSVLLTAMLAAHGIQPSPWLQIGMQSVLAAGLSRLIGLAVWWQAIQLLLPWLAGGALAIEISAHWFLAGFLLLLSLSWGAINGRVPLYLSNRKTCVALAALLPTKPGARFLDLGAGLGGVVAAVATQRPDARCHGVENAPLSWLLARLRLLGRRHATIKHGSLWHEHLGDYDVVYAFLSPAAMPALWRKVLAEMRTGSVFISNSFVVAGVPPDETIALDDRRRTTLYLWHR